MLIGIGDDGIRNILDFFGCKYQKAASLSVEHTTNLRGKRGGKRFTKELLSIYASSMDTDNSSSVGLGEGGCRVEEVLGRGR